jgi:DNA-binding NarL/FixJ family response regulator
MEAFEAVMGKQSPRAGAPGLLTLRERQIVQLIVDGRSNEEIASKIGTSSQTIKNQLTVIFSKLNVRTRVQLAVYALRQGVVE